MKVPLKLSPIAIIRYWISPLGNDAANIWVKASKLLLGYCSEHPHWRISEPHGRALYFDSFSVEPQARVWFRQNGIDNLSPEPGQFFANVTLKLLVWHWLCCKDFLWLFYMCFLHWAWSVCLSGSSLFCCSVPWANTCRACTSRTLFSCSSTLPHKPSS